MELTSNFIGGDFYPLPSSSGSETFPNPGGYPNIEDLFRDLRIPGSQDVDKFIPIPNVYDHRCLEGYEELCCAGEIINGVASRCILCMYYAAPALEVSLEALSRGVSAVGM